jgi:hypothetical protein
MKVKTINPSVITADDITEYKKRVSTLKGNFFTGNDVGMDKRIITIRMEDVDSELTLVNPKIKDTEQPKALVYHEMDTNKKKFRKTVRLSEMLVETDNLGLVEFKATKEGWEDINDLLSDVGLFECVGAQRAIDAINGIDITHPARVYSTTVTRSQPKVGRNERVMLQGPDGDMVFVKYKNSQTYLSKGYNFV